MDPGEQVGQRPVAGHGEGHPGRREGGGVQGRDRREEAPEEKNEGAVGEELAGRLDQTEFLEPAEELPGGAVAVDGAESGEADQQVDRHDDDQRPEDRPGDAAAGVLHLLAGLDDDLVPFEGNEGEAHGDEYAAQPGREEGIEVGQGCGRCEDAPEAAGDENPDDRQFADRDDVAGHPGFRGAAVVDEEKNQDDQDRQALFDQPLPEAELAWLQTEVFQQQSAVGTEAESIEGSGHGMGEPGHPAGQEPLGAAEGLLDPEVAASRFGDRRAELGIDHGGKDGDNAVQRKGEEQAGTGAARRYAGQNEDSGADHCADADHGDVEFGQVAAQVGIFRLDDRFVLHDRSFSFSDEPSRRSTAAMIRSIRRISIRPQTTSTARAMPVIRKP